MVNRHHVRGAHVKRLVGLKAPKMVLDAATKRPESAASGFVRRGGTNID
jgi:hypothetical protein